MKSTANLWHDSLSRFFICAGLIISVNIPSGLKAQAVDSVIVKSVSDIINRVKYSYAPDERSEVLDYKIISTDPLLVSIETTRQPVINEIKIGLARQHMQAIISEYLLPDSALNGENYGVTDLSVSTNRRYPKNAAEIITQTILGTPVQVLKKEGGFYFVRTPDGYLSWINTYAVVTMDEDGLKKWQQSSKIIYTATYGHAYQQPNVTSLPVSDLVAGNILQLAGQEKGFYKVMYPDKRIGYILVQEANDFKTWAGRPIPKAADIVATGESLNGVPYLWGGNSVKGLDCSGFTKTCYFLNGIVIPRDASQQALVGWPVDIYQQDVVSLSKCLKNLKPGDLLFFTSQTAPRTDKVTHTAIYIGGGQFIQSAGMVRISSLDPQASNYDDHAKTLIKARRILNAVGTPEIQKVQNHKYYTNREY